MHGCIVYTGRAETAAVSVGPLPQKFLSLYIIAWAQNDVKRGGGGGGDVTMLKGVRDGEVGSSEEWRS